MPAAVLKSADLGTTWSALNGEPVDLPTTYNHRIAIPPVDQNIYVNTIALDITNTLWALTLNPGLENEAIWLSRWAGQDWQTLRLETYVPEGRTAVESMMTIDAQDLVGLLLKPTLLIA